MDVESKIEPKLASDAIRRIPDNWLEGKPSTFRDINGLAVLANYIIEVIDNAGMYYEVENIDREDLEYDSVNYYEMAINTYQDLTGLVLQVRGQNIDKNDLGEIRQLAQKMNHYVERAVPKMLADKILEVQKALTQDSEKWQAELIEVIQKKDGKLEPRVINAIRNTPRHHHIPLERLISYLLYHGKESVEDLLDHIYEDEAVSLNPWQTDQMVKETLIKGGYAPEQVEGMDVNEFQGHYYRLSAHINASTTSQPSLIARILSNVLPEEIHEPGKKLRALEIGSGGGYVTSLLREVGYDEVIGVEMLADMVAFAREAEKSVQKGGIRYMAADGRKGLPGEVPFDSIVVSGAMEKKDIENLLKQLKVGGKLVAPKINLVGYDELMLYIRKAKGFESEKLGPVGFITIK